MAWKRHAARVSQRLGLSASGAPRSRAPVEAAYREVFDLEESLDAIFERLADFDVLAFRDRRLLRGIRGQAGSIPLGLVSILVDKRCELRTVH